MKINTIVLQFSPFKFDKVTMAFIKDRVVRYYAPLAAKINGSLRLFLADRSMNPSYKIYYDANVDQTNVREHGNIMDANEDTIVQIYMVTSVFGETLLTEEFMSIPQADAVTVMGAFDGAVATCNEANAGKNRDVYYALRPILSTLLSDVTEMYVTSSGTPGHLSIHLSTKLDTSQFNEVTIELYPVGDAAVNFAEE